MRSIEKAVLGVVALGAAVAGGMAFTHSHRAAAGPQADAWASAPPLAAPPGAARAVLARQAAASQAPAPASAAQLILSEFDARQNAPARPLDRLAVLAFANRCAPSAPGSVLASIVKVESGYNPFRIGVNGPAHRVVTPASQAEAEAVAARLIESGQSVDLGLAQINSRNLSWLGLSLADAFDPCANLAAAAKIIDQGFSAALKRSPQNRPLLETAFSLYNTGNIEAGLVNGYVGRIEAARRQQVRLADAQP
ncbi:MAG TPA: lytic transglycosylase domain-containing protein [Caulobacteraceae bacterium]|nr:lytic transglycosylase domain-containing protein [Caulobacteraceae bacterium]